MKKSLFSLLALGCCLGSMFAVVPAWGSVYLSDSFATGTNGSAGEYTTGSLYSQSASVSPFSGLWNTGLTTTAGTSAFQVVDTGLTYAGLYGVSGGSVQYTGSSTTIGSGAQTMIRDFSAISPVAGNAYYMSGLMSFDASFASNATATAYTGLLNAEQGDPGVTYTIGTQWGFQVNATGGVDAVVLNRQWVDESTIDVKTEVLASNINPGTYQFTVRVSPDYTGSSSDLMVAWSNPNAAMDEYAGPNPQVINQSAQSWLLNSGDPDRLVDSLVFTANDVPNGSVVGYDEVRFGDAWEEVVASPGTTQPVEKHPLVHDPVSLAEGANGYEMTCVELRGGYASNLGTRDEFLVGGLSSSSNLRGYLEFDLSGVEIPEGTSIDGVTLETRVKRTDIRGVGVGDIQVRLADPLASVVETEASWTNANSTTAWNKDAGDPTSVVLGSVAGDTLSTNDWVTFASSQEFVDAVSAAIAGDGLLQMTFMAPTGESNSASSGARNFVGFYSDDSSYAPTLSFSFVNDNPPQQAAPTGDLVSFASEPGDGVVASRISSGLPDNNYGDSEVLVVGAGSYENQSEIYRTVTSIPVSEEMIPEGKEVVGVLLRLTVDQVRVEGAGLGDIELRLAGDSGMTESEVTWNSVTEHVEDGAVPWSEAGGSPGELLALLDSDYAMTEGNYVWFESTEALLAAFNDALATDGMLDLLMMSPDAEEYIGISNYILFGSDDHSDVNYRPQLILQLQDTAVPEPGTIVLIISALAALALVRRK